MFLVSVVIALAEGQHLQQLAFLGIIGLLDPPRPGVREAVRTLLDSKVQVKMLTGDAKETALIIGNVFAIKFSSYHVILSQKAISQLHALLHTYLIKVRLYGVDCVFINPLSFSCVNAV